MQKLWLAGINWDQTLPHELLVEWQIFRNKLSQLASFKVPRWLGMAKAKTISLHGYCDASSKAYAAVIYVRSEDNNGNITTALVVSKTKVAPVKTVTIPRLELCGAHLLVKLLGVTRKALRLEQAEYCLGTDSTIVLAWLKKVPSTLKTYVANRISYMQTHSNPTQWHHIPTTENPADCASRGQTPMELKENMLWWSGPKYLATSSNEWKVADTKDPSMMEISVISAEVKPIIVKTFFGKTNVSISEDILQRCSSLAKAQRILAYVFRWRAKTQGKEQLTLFITADEYRETLSIFTRNDQRKHFRNEINSLLADDEVEIKSPLSSLAPMMDEQSGILRVGGRLRKSEKVFEQRHPVLLAKDSKLAFLLIKQTHFIDTMHGGPSAVIQHLRKYYWILGIRQKTKAIINRCVVCTRFGGKTLMQKMGDLPEHRIVPAKPFARSAVDYCGPFFVRSGLKRSKTVTKAYVAVFVCLVTKAAHLELVSDLSSEAFLAAFERFKSCRGTITDLYSDNGRNFVGADRQLKKDMALWLTTATHQNLATHGVTWHFAPPGSPHHGGLWESAVRSAKHHMKRILNGQTMHFEQLYTILKKIEACLNSRPLVALTDDVGDRLALTPGDLLTGAPLVATPEPDITQVPLNRIKQWKLTQRFQQEFWNRWQNEYLHTLQQRKKWRQSKDNIQVGDVVLITEENYPPTHWPLARVTKTFPGGDGLVRVVELKVKHGLTKRAIQKLVRLPTDNEEDSSETDVPAGAVCPRLDNKKKNSRKRKIKKKLRKKKNQSNQMQSS